MGEAWSSQQSDSPLRGVVCGRSWVSKGVGLTHYMCVLTLSVCVWEMCVCLCVCDCVFVKCLCVCEM